MFVIIVGFVGLSGNRNASNISSDQVLISCVEDAWEGAGTSFTMVHIGRTQIRQVIQLLLDGEPYDFD